MYNNPNWKWIVCREDRLPANDFFYLVEYKVKRISSFYLNSLVNYNKCWNISLNSKAKIQKWIVSRLDLTHTNHKGVVFKEGELEAFLDDLDNVMEILYGKT